MTSESELISEVTDIVLSDLEHVIKQIDSQFDRKRAKMNREVHTGSLQVRPSRRPKASVRRGRGSMVKSNRARPSRLTGRLMA
jgi:hypothetical protein